MHIVGVHGYTTGTVYCDYAHKSESYEIHLFLTLEFWLVLFFQAGTRKSNGSSEKTARGIRTDETTLPGR